MKKAYIDPNKCDSSPFCISKRVCPVGAIIQEKKGMFKASKPIVSEEICIGCKKCVSVCPHNAISMK